MSPNLLGNQFGTEPIGEVSTLHNDMLAPLSPPLFAVQAEALSASNDDPLEDKWSYKYAKRGLDLVVATIGCIVLLPLMLAIAVAIKLTSPGPVFYRWDVVGHGGRRFLGYKFRTMVVNADQLKEELWQHNERKGPTFKMKQDPRVTALGQLLRRFSLDELPQLLSVLKGDMSLVGPRPVGVEEWKHFENWQRRKLNVIPGGTCLWHIKGKPEDFNAWIRLDLDYIEQWSLWLDLKILAGTLVYVVSGRNY